MTCQGCNSSLTDCVQYTCLQCNLNLCQDCEGTHMSHIMMRIPVALQNQVHKPYACDGCQTPDFIKGIRYHCLDCKDFDLCGSCNATMQFSRSSKHSASHTSLFIVSPSDEITENLGTAVLVMPAATKAATGRLRFVRRNYTRLISGMRIHCQCVSYRRKGQIFSYLLIVDYPEIRFTRFAKSTAIQGEKETGYAKHF